MKRYYSPQLKELLSCTSTIIAVSVINGGSADKDTPIQVNEDSFFEIDWGGAIFENDNAE